MGKAIYKGKTRDKNGYAVHLFYEYRGYEYMITDGHNGYSETLRTQHEHEQKRIDKIIEFENEQKGKEQTYKGSAQEGIDLFWNYVENGETE